MDERPPPAREAALDDEGLFDEAFKKPLPVLPRRIALVTSPTGAAVHDFLTLSLRRYANLAVDIVPVQVQGASAAEEIAAALANLDRWQRSDVIVLARGGGSLEDLQAFNSETVARAIFSTRIPVVSAVGHETDYTIADFVADVRAPTPSAAAEMVVADRQEFLLRLFDHRRRIVAAMAGRVETLQQHLSGTTRRMTHPRRRIDELRLRIDDMSGRASRAFRRSRERRKEQLAWLTGRLQTAAPFKTVDKLKQKNHINKDKLLYLINKKVIQIRSHYQETEGRLTALSPHAVLKRGYSITRTEPDDRIVMDPETIPAGQPLRITLAHGDLYATARKDRSPPDPES